MKVFEFRSTAVIGITFGGSGDRAVNIFLKRMGGMEDAGATGWSPLLIMNV